MRKSFFHMMPLTSVFLFCLFTSSSVGLSCLLFPLNFRQPPPTYFIANKILYQSKSVACIKNRHEWKKTRPLYPRKYIKCPESFQSYQMHRTNFKICSQNNKTAMYSLNYFLHLFFIIFVFNKQLFRVTSNKRIFFSKMSIKWYERTFLILIVKLLWQKLRLIWAMAHVYGGFFFINICPIDIISCICID